MSKSIETRIVELRAAEGGADARLLVPVLAQAYLSFAAQRG